MRTRKKSVLALGIVAVLIGMSFATVPMSVGGNGVETLPPTVTKTVSPTDISFGSIETETTVTIEVTGDGGTSSTITPMDVVFAIDSSGSMTWNDEFNLRLDAASSFLGKMDDTRDLAGVVSWDYYIDFIFGLSDDFDATDGVDYWIYQVDSYGSTNLNVGLYEAIDMLDAGAQEDSVKVIIFLTDGQGTYTYYSSGGPAADAAAAGYIIYSIGLGSPSSGPLVDMAFYTGGAYYDSPDAGNLQAIYDAIYEEIVTSTQPHYVKVIEVLEEYIVLNEASFNIEPDSITYNLDGTTTIVWEDIGQYVGDEDSALKADESVTLTFDVGADKPGYQMEVQVEDEAIVEYSDKDGTYVGDVDIPQAYINVAQSANLIADGGDEYIDVGDVIIWQDADYLYVKYVTDDGWYMTETHLHVEDVFLDTPQTKKGNPKIGKFDYSGDHSPAVQEVTYQIDWTWASDALLFISAHAVVQKDISLIECTEPEWRIETAWGEGEDFGGASWAMVIEYQDP